MSHFFSKSNLFLTTGDWIMLQSLVQTERRADMLLEVDRVVPLRTQTLEGKVSHYNEHLKRGIVDTAVVFSLDVCQPGYIPRTGDKVSTSKMEFFFSLRIFWMGRKEND